MPEAASRRGAWGTRQLAPKTLLRASTTVDNHKLDPTLHDEVEGAPEIDFFRDYAYPANKMRWKKNTKQVSSLTLWGCTANEEPNGRSAHSVRCSVMFKLDRPKLVGPEPACARESCREANCLYLGVYNVPVTRALVANSSMAWGC